MTEPGACVGEMSLLLGVPATADVVASERSVVAVIDDAQAMLETEPRLPLALARLLAARLHVMTTYLADIKQQYADHEGGLGMVDVVLGSLMRSSGSRAASSARNAIPSPSTRPRANDCSSTPGERRPPRASGVGVELDARRHRARSGGRR